MCLFIIYPYCVSPNVFHIVKLANPGWLFSDMKYLCACAIRIAKPGNHMYVHKHSIATLTLGICM